MAKRTFKFIGSQDKKNPYTEIEFFDPESGTRKRLKKGETFTTEHPTLITQFEEQQDMEDADAKGTKTSPRSDDHNS